VNTTQNTKRKIRAELSLNKMVSFRDIGVRKFTAISNYFNCFFPTVSKE